MTTQFIHDPLGFVVFPKPTTVTIPSGARKTETTATVIPFSGRGSSRQFYAGPDTYQIPDHAQFRTIPCDSILPEKGVITLTVLDPVGDTRYTITDIVSFDTTWGDQNSVTLTQSPDGTIPDELSNARAITVAQDNNTVTISGAGLTVERGESSLSTAE